MPFSAFTLLNSECDYYYSYARLSILKLQLFIILQINYTII